MSATAETLALLKSIDASLKELLALSKSKKRAETATVGFAPDSDLDSAHGNEQIRFDPRDWNGPSFKGKRMSECPAAYLDLLADAYAYFAKKNDESYAKADNGELKSKYDRRSEARARGWAARVRAGVKPEAPAAAFPSDTMNADEISF
jgi:hypothetical protein